MNTIPAIDLIKLIESDLGQGRKSGRWMLYHCPFPGHKRGDKNPSLTVTNGDTTRPPWWKCWTCGKGGGAVKWMIEYRGLSFQDALQALKINKPDPNQPRQAPPIQQPDRPPSGTWQTRALHLIDRAESALWDDRGRDALAWLRARGLRYDTIRAARLGYLPRDFTDKPAAWGTPNDDPRPLYFSKGLLIPGFAASKVWYLKIRPDHPRDGQKYKHARGGKQALYNADALTHEKPAVICEGELDALLLSQEVKDLASVITLASANNDLNLATWGLYFMRPSCFILAYDMDKAGDEGAAKLAWLHDTRRLNIPTLRAVDKDLTDFHKSGGNLYSLIESVIRDDAPIFVNWPEDAKPATIHGQYWRNPDNCLEAFYSPAELAQCLEVMQSAAEPITESL